MRDIQKGFTLIELLVVIAVIAVLAAILFPVFAKAREKARQTQCLNNQRQIVTAIQLYCQDHDEVLPEAGTFWQSLNVPPQILVCPTAGKKVANGYVCNSFIAGKALGDIASPSNAILTIDGQAPLNIATAKKHFAFRHTEKAVVAFLDGHVESRGPKQAALFWVVRPKAASASSGTDGKKTIDGSGFASTEQATLASGMPVPDTWPTMPTTAPWNVSWQSNPYIPPAGEWLQLDLGTTMEISGVRIWNLYEAGSYATRCMRAFTISLSDDGTSFTPVPVSPVKELGKYSTNKSGEEFTFDGLVSCRYLRITCVTNYGHVTTAPNGHVGLGEVRCISPYAP